MDRVLLSKGSKQAMLIFQHFWFTCSLLVFIMNVPTFVLKLYFLITLIINPEVGINIPYKSQKLKSLQDL